MASQILQPGPAWGMRHMTGLVLTAGGARGAYQAGVLKRIGKIRALRGRPLPFPIVAGASAGAINGAALGAYGSDFSEGTVRLARLWSQLGFADVVRTDLLSLGHNGLRLSLDLLLGGLTGAGRVASLVDAAPLRAFLAQQLPMEGISNAIARGHLYALAITATGYHSGKAFTFIQGRAGHPLWNKSRRVALSTTLAIDHVLASAAIPLVFPPVPLKLGNATAYFGDGALRLVTPLSPAIRLGAEKLLAIGVRCKDAAADLVRTELSITEPENGADTTLRRPPLSQICGVFMNAIFLDHLDADLDHLNRMNDLVAVHQDAGHTAPRHARDIREPMRVVTPLTISPSEDLAAIASTMTHRMPRVLRYLLDALGKPDAQSADLTSFLLFDANFTRELVAIGYRDASQRIDEIETFLMDRTHATHSPHAAGIGPAA